MLDSASIAQTMPTLPLCLSLPSEISHILLLLRGISLMPTRAGYHDILVNLHLARLPAKEGEGEGEEEGGREREELEIRSWLRDNVVAACSMAPLKC